MKDRIEKASNIKKKYSRRKYIIEAVIILCLFTGYVYKVVTWTPIDSELQKASEAIIRQAAAEQLSISPNYPVDPNSLTDKDFAKITELHICGKDFCDIKLLEKFINLENLWLAAVQYNQNKIPKWMRLLEKIGIFNLKEKLTIDLSPLENLSKLEVLNLSHMTIMPFDSEQISFLSIDITREYAPFRNLRPLSSLVNLKELDLSGTLVRDLGPIKKLTSLEKLNLSKSNVTSLKPIKGLVNLKIIDLTETAVKNLELLRNLSNLEELYLGDTQVSSLEPLKGLTNLNRLQFFNTQVSDLEPLRELQNLVDLSFWSNKITNLEPLGNLVNLEKFNFADEQVLDIEPISHMTKLKSLKIFKIPVSDIEPLKKLSNLNILVIDNCPNITDEQVEDLKKAFPNLKNMR